MCCIFTPNGISVVNLTDFILLCVCVENLMIKFALFHTTKVDSKNGYQTMKNAIEGRMLKLNF